MGCCFSDESSEQASDAAERSRLLPDVAAPEQSYGTRIQDTSPSPDTHPKTDEQSALNRILLNAANNVIDVAQLDNQTMEQQEYIERARQYGSRLAMRCSTSHTLYHTCNQALPPGVAAPQSVLAAPALSANDILLITNAANNAAKLVTDIKVKHKEDLVVPFGVP